MKRFVTAVIAAGATALGATGCGDDPVKEGSVLHMNFTPAHDSHEEVTDYTILCTGGQYITCYPIPIGSHIETHHHPDRWQAELLDCHPDSTCRTGWVDISETEYHNWQIGTYFPIQRDLDKKYGADRQWG